MIFLRNKLGISFVMLSFVLAGQVSTADGSLKTGTARIFLKNHLPLSLIMTTPMELAGKQPTIPVSGRQPLTAVFSRPVIALGSDFGQPSAQLKLPFSLRCPVPGKFRWVTTSIARFDPDVDWPTDLNCTLYWNTGLTTYDGAALDLGKMPSQRTLITSIQGMHLRGITSEQALNLTDGLWSSNNMNNEVPPDGWILLGFKHPVNLQLLKSALKVVETDGDGPGVPFDVSPCPSPAPWIYGFLGTSSSSATSSSSWSPGSSLLDVNTTCAQITPLAILRAATAYSVRLPRGARYHALAGPLKKDLNVVVAGLQPFQVPFSERYSQAEYGTRYRRLDLWLPHGLSSDTLPEALAARISLFAEEDMSCTAVPFTFSLVSRARARLSIPRLKAQNQYRISVAADSRVKDGFGQALVASSFTFWTGSISYVSGLPSLTNVVTVIEAGVDTLSAWPTVTPNPIMPGEDFNWIYAWELNLVNTTAMVLLAEALEVPFSRRDKLLSVFGPPTCALSISKLMLSTFANDTSDWIQLRMPLRDTSTPSRARLIAYHRDQQVLWPPVYFNLVLNTTLSFHILHGGQHLTAWVTDVALGGAPVAGATVSVFHHRPQSLTPDLLVQCVTDSSGMCTMTHSTDDNGRLAAFAVADGQFAVLESAGFAHQLFFQPEYIATLVADRLVVVPGDSVKITGFVQQTTAISGLQLPPASYAALIISPNWDTDSSTTIDSAAVPIKISGTTSTFHVELPVPKTAKLHPYTVQLSIPGPGTQGTDPTGPAPTSTVLHKWPSVSGAQLQITVADFRAPTVDLKLSAPAWSFPNSSVPFTATAVSYIGASVAGGPITITWRTAKASGTLNLIADQNGLVEGNIDLGALPTANRSEPYDTLAIDMEWIGPTRERITRSASVTLADGPARLNLQLSLTPSVPSTAFAIAATLTSNTDGAALSGVPVTVTLRPAPNGTMSTNPSADCSTSSSCTVSSGAPFSASCQLALPCVGKFLLEACADVPATMKTVDEAVGPLGSGTQQQQQQRVCSSQVLGRNASEWLEAPWSQHSVPTLFTDKVSYSIGDIVKVQLQNPWPGASLLLQWGNRLKNSTKVVYSLSSGLVEVTLGALANEARGGAAVVAVLDIPRLSAEHLPRLPLPEQLPVSALFDPRAPHSHVLRAGLNVRAGNELAVSVAVAAASSEGAGMTTIFDVDGSEVVAVEPGSQAQITVNVKNGLQANATAPAAGTVEVTVYGVDKAILDLMPYKLSHPEQEMVLKLVSDIHAYGMSAYRLAPGAVRAVYDKLMSRLTSIDPWLPVDTSVQPTGCSVAAVDVNDTAYISRYSTPITDESGLDLILYSGRASSGVSGPLFLVLKDGIILGSNGRGKGTSISGTVSVRQEIDFVVTPLFTTAVISDDSGTVSLTFPAPPNLGTFVIRAYAAAGSSACYGSGEAKVAVRRRVSLTPSLPRFARVGDTFQAGVLVTVGSAPATVNVALQVRGGSLQVTSSLQKVVAFAAGSGLQQEVCFNFSAVAVGNANLSFTAEDQQRGGGADALQLQLSVKGQQADVWVATSFALTGANTTTGSSSSSSGSKSRSVVQWQEGMVLPAAVPGSGGLDLTSGVGNFPAIASAYGELEQTDADRSYAAAVPAVLWATIPAVLSYYGQTISDSQADLATRSFRELSTLTHSRFGLIWSDPARWVGWRPSIVDVQLNTRALFVVDLHGPAMRASPFSASWAFLESNLLQKWRTAVGLKLVEDAVASRLRQNPPGRYSDWYSLAWARLVLGADWAPSDASSEIQNDLSIGALVNANDTMGRQTRVLTSLVLQTMGDKNQLVSSTIAEVTSALRVQGRTAYMAASAGAMFAASLHDQALALLLLLRSGATHQLLPKLAAYIASPPAVGGYFRGCWMDRVLVVVALAEYDRARGSSKPNLDLLAEVNGLTVLEASFRTNTTRPVANFTGWEDIPAPPQDSTPSKLNFKVTGSGEVTVAASLHFAPAELLSYPTYRGLYVESALQLVDPATGGPTGQRVSAVPLASVVVLTVQVTSPDDVGPVTLSVMMPAGLEPLDPNLDTSRSGVNLGCDLDNLVHGWEDFFRRWWWPICPSQETRPSVVTFSYLALRAGTSTVAFRAVAVTAGTFVLPPVKAEADNQPELMGMTAASTLVVCADCDKPTFASQPPVPRGCPNSCSGRGRCNPQTGRCTCGPGFTRADCSRAVA